MGMERTSPRQYVLDYQSRHQERHAKLNTALREIARTQKVALHHAKFLEWIANVEGEIGLVRDRDQIAENLWISVPTVTRMVRSLLEWRLIRVAEKKYASGVQAPNEYRIDWDGVAWWYQQVLARQGLRPVDAADQHDPPGCHDDTPGYHHDPLEITSRSLLGEENNLPPLLAARASMGDAGEEEEEVFFSGANGETPSASADRPASAWSAVRAALRATGLRAVDAAVSEAQRRRMPPRIVQEAADFFQRHRERWQNEDQPPGHECGALMFFLRQWRPGDAVDDWNCWPSASRLWRIREAQARADQQRRQAGADSRRREESNRQWHASLEASHGGELDSLAPAELDALVATLPVSVRAMLRSTDLRRRPLVGYTRTCLLEHLASVRSSP